MASYKKSKQKRNTVSALSALTASALAIPALHANAATAPTESEVGYHYSSYEEDDAPSAKVATGDTNRYSITTQQFRLLSPIGKNFSVSLNVLSETMSGASPLGTQSDGSGNPVLVMSGASGIGGIKEDRDDISANITHYGESFTTSFTAGQSDEKDYAASYYGLGLEWEFNNKNSAFQVAVSQSDDKVTPTDAVLFGRTLSATKETSILSLGFSQVLNKTNLIQFGLEFSEDTGYLDAPYKTEDIRPSSRSRQSAIVRTRTFFAESNAALHFNYRYYWDDWEVTSHTFNFAWHKNVNDSFQVIPSLRYYTQTEASFYEPYKVISNTNPYYTSDYRLSPYGAIAFGLQGIHSFKNWSYTAKIERYEADSKYSFNKVAIENPGLVSYTLLTVGFTVKF